MEVGQLLNSIVEVSQAVTRMPCTPEDKKEVLEKIKDLFSSYTAISNAFASASSRPSGKEQTLVLKEQQTLVKESSTAGATQGLAAAMQAHIHTIDEKLVVMEQKLSRLESQQREGQGAGEGESDLRSQIVTQAATLQAMKGSQDSLCHRIAVIENKSNDLELLQDRIQQLSALVEGDSSFAQELLKIHKEIASLEASVKDAKGSKNIVAFSASARTRNRKYTADSVIHFHDVAFNFFNCYDSVVSMFRAKLVGLYVFSTSINTNSQGDFEAAIVHNGTDVALFGTPGNKDLQTGSTAVLWLNPNDTVYVKARETQQDNHGGVEIGGGFSNFIGYKIA